MSYRKSTLRKMAPVTRKYARLLGELESVLRKGKNLVEEIAQLEHDSRALANAREGEPLSVKRSPRNHYSRTKGGDASGKTTAPISR